jgi:hypothetical protein
VSDRKEQKFSAPRSARVAAKTLASAAARFPAQAFHDQSVDLLKELLRDSDVFLALRIDGLWEHDNFGIPVSPLPHLFRRFAVGLWNIAHVAFRSSLAFELPKSAPRSLFRSLQPPVAPVIGFEFFVTMP